jgi:hypothetical protein
VRKVNYETGEFEILAEGMCNPNGVAFGPKYEKFYVGSFGCGTIHVFDKLPDGSWDGPKLFMDLQKGASGPPVAIDPPPLNYAPCDALALGDPCVTADGGAGACESGPAGLDCVASPEAPDPKLAACEGEDGGAPCSLTWYGVPHSGVCLTGGFAADCCEVLDKKGCGNDLCEECICAFDTYCCDTHWDSICVDEANNQCKLECSCDLVGTGGGAAEAGECLVGVEPAAWCEGKAKGDVCAFVKSPDEIVGGLCKDAAQIDPPPGFPSTGIVCVPASALVVKAKTGGLDGLNVDECGWVYVTEYIEGLVWRMDPKGTVLEKAAKLPSSWIPNMHWSKGVGGWDPKVLYVMSLGSGAIYGLEVDKYGKEATLVDP